ncbi:hypothetical protein F4820DRAFT_89331 [Hypoxylon rubiginosum]|uniref:Uncharacterized protein n=1 Tax=Hypoxylon rubiginosum TaxID=110542 RepID=A0ACB9ZAJ9_9PEZI|nr:hypothetical protein F4820DRAFT_89331 [Hypoxylon rubiginosum]
MKISIIFRRIIAALGATLVFGKTNSLEIEAEKNDTNGDNTLSPNKMAPTLEVPAAGNRTTSKFVELFDLDNANTGPMRQDTMDDWIIPVSHWACTEWTDLGDTPVRKAIQAMIDWSAKPLGWIQYKSMHYELADDAGAFVCNCKYCCIDRCPADEMWEFYERLRANCGGEGRSGWIFSKQWDKGYAVASADSIEKKRTKTNLCPPNCSVM